MLFQLSYRFSRVAGVVCFVTGLAGDCLEGWLLLHRGAWQPILWHVFFALLWTLGVNLLIGQGKSSKTTFFSFPNKWGIAALLLGAGTFPGFGTCAYSIAFVFARYLFASSSLSNAVAAEPEPQTTWPQEELSRTRDRAVLPFVDDLYEGNTEARRAVVAKLSRHANPEATQLLRQLLSDAQAEIRSDASIALARLEDEMSRALNLSFDDWQAHPADNERALVLVDHYYQYAASNVLDKMSQRFYLVLARDLLLRVIAGGRGGDAQLWFKLANIRQHLGELAEALQDALRAVQIQPEAPDASLLAMDLAFRSHAWDILISLAGQHTGAQSSSAGEPVAFKPFQAWSMPRLGVSGGVRHE